MTRFTGTRIRRGVAIIAGIYEFLREPLDDDGDDGSSGGCFAQLFELGALSSMTTRASKILRLAAGISLPRPRGFPSATFSAAVCLHIWGLNSYWGG